MIEEMRYSMRHNGWFWGVKVRNPLHVECGGEMDIYYSGFSRTRKRADRAARKAIAKIEKQIQRGRREIEGAA